jgi:hypothetical protein
VQEGEAWRGVAREGERGQRERKASDEGVMSEYLGVRERMSVPGPYSRVYRTAYSIIARRT